MDAPRARGRSARRIHRANVRRVGIGRRRAGVRRRRGERVALGVGRDGRRRGIARRTRRGDGRGRRARRRASRAVGRWTAGTRRRVRGGARGATLGSEAAWLRESTDACAHPLFAGMERVALATGVQLRVLQRLPQTASFARRFASIGYDEDDSDASGFSSGSPSESSSAWRLAFSPAALASASSRRRRETAAMERAADDAIASMAATRAAHGARAEARRRARLAADVRASRRVGIARRGARVVSSKGSPNASPSSRRGANARGGGEPRRWRAPTRRRTRRPERRRTRRTFAPSWRGNSPPRRRARRRNRRKRRMRTRRERRRTRRERRRTRGRLHSRGRRRFRGRSHPRTSGLLPGRIFATSRRIDSTRPRTRRTSRFEPPTTRPRRRTDPWTCLCVRRTRRCDPRRARPGTKGTRPASRRVPGNPTRFRDDEYARVSGPGRFHRVRLGRVRRGRGERPGGRRGSLLDDARGPAGDALPRDARRVRLARGARQTPRRLATGDGGDARPSRRGDARRRRREIHPLRRRRFSSALVEGVEAAARADAARGGWGATSHALRDALHAAVKESAASADPLAARVALRPRTEEVSRLAGDGVSRLDRSSFSEHSARMMDHVDAEYRVEWPVSLLFPSSSRALLADANRATLRGKHASSALREAHARVHEAGRAMYSSRGAPKLRTTPATRRLRRLALLSSEFRHFARAVESHAGCRVHGAAAGRLAARLRDAKTGAPRPSDLYELRDAMMEHARNAHEGCLLADRDAPPRRGGRRVTVGVGFSSRVASMPDGVPLIRRGCLRDRADHPREV